MVTYLGINYNDSTYNLLKNQLGYAGALKKKAKVACPPYVEPPKRERKRAARPPKGQKSASSGHSFTDFCG